ncbi:helix-turn-helix transcriptional regulator [Paracidovorax wautersii]|uniref:DNA-binding transcriptional regulator, CsgD family n=1 Tax=Paracidovorax wautersii TaxID=1177982 RepID=A0A1I2G681_9BURK|nr:hypothetical protein [Paracidovorax wautersii]SFF13135.1 DNA-binding transcriptional regulator, CsgD family [Paracidovorax wautersii]
MQHSTNTIRAQLYDGVLRPAAWHSALDLLGRRLGAGIFHSFTLDDSGAEVPESTSNLERQGLDTRLLSEYEIVHAHNDLRMAVAMSLPVGQVMFDHEHISAREATRNSVYTDWLLPLGFRHTLAVTLRMQPRGARDFLSFLRPRDANPYTEEDRALTHQLMPDLVRAARLRAHMVGLARRASLGLAALDGVHQGIAIVDGALRIQHLNAVAKRLLKPPSPLRVRNGQFLGVQGDADARLRQMTREACAPLGRASTFELPQANGPALVVSVLPLHADTPLLQLNGTPHPHALIVLTGAGLPVAGHQAVAEMLDLSPTETRLALCLASGRSVKDFALLEGCSWHTARTHARNLLRKSGCHRQIDLVRILHALRVA